MHMILCCTGSRSTPGDQARTSYSDDIVETNANSYNSVSYDPAPRPAVKTSAPNGSSGQNAHLDKQQSLRAGPDPVSKQLSLRAGVDPVSKQQSLRASAETVSKMSSLRAGREPVGKQESLRASAEPVSKQQRLKAAAEPYGKQQSLRAGAGPVSNQESLGAGDAVEPFDKQLSMKKNPTLGNGQSTRKSPLTDVVQNLQSELAQKQEELRLLKEKKDLQANQKAFNNGGRPAMLKVDSGERREASPLRHDVVRDFSGDVSSFGKRKVDSPRAPSSKSSIDARDIGIRTMSTSGLSDLSDPDEFETYGANPQDQKPDKRPSWAGTPPRAGLSSDGEGSDDEDTEHGAYRASAAPVPASNYGAVKAVHDEDVSMKSTAAAAAALQQPPQVPPDSPMDELASHSAPSGGPRGAWTANADADSASSSSSSAIDHNALSSLSSISQGAASANTSRSNSPHSMRSVSDGGNSMDSDSPPSGGQTWAAPTAKAPQDAESLAAVASKHYAFGSSSGVHIDDYPSNPPLRPSAVSTSQSSLDPNLSAALSQVSGNRSPRHLSGTHRMYRVEPASQRAYEEMRVSSRCGSKASRASSSSRASNDGATQDKNNPKGSRNSSSSAALPAYMGETAASASKSASENPQEECREGGTSRKGAEKLSSSSGAAALACRQSAGSSTSERSSGQTRRTGPTTGGRPSGVPPTAAAGAGASVLAAASKEDPNASKGAASASKAQAASRGDGSASMTQRTSNGTVTKRSEAPSAAPPSAAAPPPARAAARAAAPQSPAAAAAVAPSPPPPPAAPAPARAAAAAPAGAAGSASKVSIPSAVSAGAGAGLPFGVWRFVRLKKPMTCAACDGTEKVETVDGGMELFQCDVDLQPGVLASVISHNLWSGAGPPSLKTWVFCPDPLCMGSKPEGSDLPGWPKKMQLEGSAKVTRSEFNALQEVGLNIIAAKKTLPA